MIWRIGMAFLVLICCLAGAACGSTAAEPVSRITEPAAQAQPTSRPTALPQATETAEPEPILFDDIPVQAFVEAEEALHLDLRQYLNIGEHAGEDLIWGLTDSLHLEAEIKNGVLTTVPRDLTWSGSELIQVEACTSSGQCVQTEVEILRAEQQFQPHITGFGQRVAFSGEVFPQIDLDQRVIDLDHPPAELHWTFSGAENLVAAVEEQMLVVEPAAEDWRGQETLALEVCDPDGLCDSSEVVFSIVDEAQLELTYIVNEGFVIQVGGKKILVDGLLSEVGSYQLPVTVQRAMIGGQPPFADIDLALATHSHTDHFDPQVVNDFLAANPEAYFVSTSQAASAVSGRAAGQEAVLERVKGVYPTRGVYEQLVLNGIEIRAFNLPHSNYQNLGFLIDLGGVRILHTGDFFMDEAQDAIDLLQRYGLPEAGIDIAFIAAPFLQYERYAGVVPQGIQPGLLVPMHYVASQTVELFDLLEERYPDSLLFYEEMESKQLTFPQ